MYDYVYYNSNVEKYPESDVFRRVRVSSELFDTEVWQHTEARQFLARSGWVQVINIITHQHNNTLLLL